jgi:hypothetical protein
MCVITTSVPDLSVQDRDPVPGLGPVRGALLSAGQHPVRPPELALRFAQEPWVRDRLAI